MACTLSCPCGATFEVAESFAGQAVQCPECQAELRVPAVSRGPVRTSGWAIASLVLALIGAFTVLGTVVAVLCGLVALVSVGRSGGRLAGAGLAVFGIILGTLFTGLTLFAYSTGELFGVGDQVRLRMMAGRVDYGGPLEIVREREGFAITRPSEKWGLARPEYVHELDPRAAVLLVNPARDAYLAVEEVPNNGQTTDALRQEIVTEFRNLVKQGDEAQHRGQIRRVSDLRVRSSARVEPRDGCEVGEVLLDVREIGQALTYLIRVVKPPRGNRAYILRSWTYHRNYTQMEPELRRLMDSFRVVDGPPGRW